MPTTTAPPHPLRRAADAEALDAYRALQDAVDCYRKAMARVRAQKPRRKLPE
jgi:hypothetical protein